MRSGPGPAGPEAPGRLPSPEASGPAGPGPDFKMALPTPGAPKTKTGHETHVFILKIHHLKKWKTDLFFDPSQRISP